MRHNALTIYLPNLITVVFLSFIESQLTTDAQNVLHMNQCTHEHVLKWNVPGLMRMVWEASNMSWWNVHFELELNALRILSVPRIKIWGTEVGRTEGVWGGGSTSKTVSGHTLIWTFLLVSMWGNHSWSLPKHFRHILYSSTQVSLLPTAIKQRRPPTSLTGVRRHARFRFMTT
jgi:hypothetical protein